MNIKEIADLRLQGIHLLSARHLAVCLFVCPDTIFATGHGKTAGLLDYLDGK